MNFDTNVFLQALIGFFAGGVTSVFCHVLSDFAINKTINRKSTNLKPQTKTVPVFAASSYFIKMLIFGAVFVLCAKIGGKICAIAAIPGLFLSHFYLIFKYGLKPKFQDIKYEKIEEETSPISSNLKPSEGGAVFIKKPSAEISLHGKKYKTFKRFFRYRKLSS